MRIILLVVGKTTEKHFIEGLKDYADRLGHYTDFRIEVIPELRNTKSLSEDVQKEEEGKLILKSLQPGDDLILLDERGKEMRSLEFAEWLQTRFNRAPRRLVFLIGGPYGFSPQVREKANAALSLSRMTFSHQMIRLIFAEQLYRAFTILHNQPYHHE
ncbi:MAG: 23S rRNA (pseudouridine(1915)-N(3))-methyltransferase RlmH [Bacteroidaceae bacterium]|jgi:23S rRNA (pseudouridine1915-N3)-methyltransferase